VDRYRISDATFYKWKARYGGLELSEARQLRALEDENAKLKRRSRTTCRALRALRKARSSLAASTTSPG
jgi:hypothetical protein